MIKAHLKIIMNHSIHRITNVREEGINLEIVLIDKMAFGYMTRQRLKTAICFRGGNLQLYL